MHKRKYIDYAGLTLANNDIFCIINHYLPKA